MCIASCIAVSRISLLFADMHFPFHYRVNTVNVNTAMVHKKKDCKCDFYNQYFFVVQFVCLFLEKGTS